MLLDDDDDVASLRNQGHALLLDKTSEKSIFKTRNTLPRNVKYP